MKENTLCLQEDELPPGRINVDGAKSVELSHPGKMSCQAEKSGERITGGRTSTCKAHGEMRQRRELGWWGRCRQ